MSKVRLSRRLKKEIPKQLWRRTKVQFLLKRANRFHLIQLASQKTAKAFDGMQTTSKR